ncbi:MAG: IS5 family transposase [Prevotella sp.]|nr:IS5 family transposase [Prevotella sp.]
MNNLKLYRNLQNKNLFEEELTVEALSLMGNPLDMIEKVIDFELFRDTLEDVLLNKERKSNAGRPQIDVVQMFKVLFLQRYFGLGDHQIEYQIIDRTSFRQFLGIQTVSDIPDEKTVWAFREKLVNSGAFDRLFDDFRRFLDEKGLRLQEGKIIDATFVPAPRQRNSREVNKTIKAGRGDTLWNSEEGDTAKEKKSKKAKKSHKDIDARWTKKRGETIYGYKQHTKVDKGTKLIETYKTTAANVHDSKVVGELLEESDKGQNLSLDAGYVGKEEEVEKHGMNPVICEKGSKGHPFTEEQIKNNRKKSKVRCRVEHVYGFIEGAMHGSLVRSIGIVRAAANSALTCLVYNMFRFEQINRLQPELIKIKG